MSMEQNGASEVADSLKVAVSRDPTKLVRFALKDLVAGNPERDAFTADEIAFQALAHHPRYMNRKRQPRKAPGRFKMPLIASGLDDLGRSRELGHRFEDDEGEVVYDPQDEAFIEKGKPNNLGIYTKVYYLMEDTPAHPDAPINGASNGNGALSIDQAPQALIDDVRNTA